MLRKEDKGKQNNAFKSLNQRYRDHSDLLIRTNWNFFPGYSSFSPQLFDLYSQVVIFVFPLWKGRLSIHFYTFKLITPLRKYKNKLKSTGRAVTVSERMLINHIRHKHLIGCFSQVQYIIFTREAWRVTKMKKERCCLYCSPVSLSA